MGIIIKLKYVIGEGNMMVQMNSSQINVRNVNSLELRPGPINPDLIELNRIAVEEDKKA